MTTPTICTSGDPWCKPDNRCTGCEPIRWLVATGGIVVADTPDAAEAQMIAETGARAGGSKHYLLIRPGTATDGVATLMCVVNPDGTLRNLPQVPVPIRQRVAISDETIAEAAAMEERDRAAGGPPWEVADHPDHQLPGGWHRGQIR